MEKLGFPKEKRPFTQHLTIGRGPTTLTPLVRDKLTALAIELGLNPPHSLTLRTLILMKSTLYQTGDIYELLATANIGI